jgi:Effector-associated domain 11
MKQTLQNLISAGKLSEAMAQATEWAKNSTDADTYKSIILLSQRHATNEKENLRGGLAQADYLMERNRISGALLAVIEGAEEKSILPPIKQSYWLGIGAFFIGLVALLANIGTIKDAFFKKEPLPAITQPVAPPKSVEPTIILPEKPKKAVETSTPPVEPSKTAAEPKSVKENVKEKVQNRIEKAKNRFESRDQSKQINVPDNKGTININQ